MLPSTTVLSAVALNTVISYILGTFWYSYNGFGQLWINSCFGTSSNFEINRKKRNEDRDLVVTLLSTVFYNIILIFLVNHVYSPTDFKEAFFMSLVIVTIHVLLEVSHIGYEVRSYSTLTIHTAFHFLMTYIPIIVLIMYYKMPSII